MGVLGRKGQGHMTPQNPQVPDPKSTGGLAVGLTFATVLSPGPFLLREEGSKDLMRPVRPHYLPAALLTNITQVGTPTPGSCRTLGREAAPRPRSWVPASYCWKNSAPAAPPLPGPLEEF